MRTPQIIMLLVCLGLLLLDAAILVAPLYAMSCEAECGDGESVSCGGDSCEAVNGVGCFYTVGDDSQFVPCSGQEPQ